MKALSGKKTYFTAGAAVLTALGAYFAGEVDMQTTISAIFASLMAIFLRKGIPRLKRPRPQQKKSQQSNVLAQIYLSYTWLFVQSIR